MSLNDVFGPFKGRPDHPDMTALTDIVLQHDGRTEDRTFDFQAYIAAHVDPDSITHMAMQRAMRTTIRMGRDPDLMNPKVLVTIASVYLDAFIVGYQFHERYRPSE